MLRLLLGGLLLLALISAPVSMWGQGTSATVSGFITDATGAKIPGALVSLTDVATGSVAKATTNGEGLYRVAGLPPGIYNATVSMQGFKTEVRQGLDLHLEDQVSLDYVLTIGASSAK